MSLTATVGLVGVALASEDDPGFTPLREQVDELNRLLRSAGLPPHEEPELDDDPLEVSLGSYGFLHRLRRVAAYRWAGEPAPEPGPAPLDDPVLDRYYRDDGAGGEPRFDHLILHSDHDGFYVPLRFERVLHGSPDGVGSVGSSYALVEELELLREGLGEDTVERATCDELLEAARASIEQGALLVFA
jgi:hypothetical protein